MTHDPEAGRKLRETLGELGQEGMTDGSVDSAIAVFFPETDMDARMLEVVFEHAFRYFFSVGKLVYESLLDQSGNVSMRAFDEQMETIIQRKTRLQNDQRRRLRQNIKQAVLTSTGDRPKRRTREKILNRQRDRLCYLCGLEIRDDQEQTLDHRWPRSAGGGNGADNLYRAHKHCEEVKADIAFASDTAYGRIAYTRMPKFLEEAVESNIIASSMDYQNTTTCLDDVRSAQMRVGVLQRQNFRCTECELDFRDSGKALLAKRDNAEPWWFNNIEAVCKTCYEKGIKNA